MELSAGSEVAAILREQLEKAEQRERDAIERAKRAEALLDTERERADRYERERNLAMANLFQRQESERQPGLLRRIFGR